MNLSVKDDDADNDDDEIIDSGIQDTVFKFNSTFEVLLNLYKREYAAPFPSCVTLGGRHPNSKSSGDMYPPCISPGVASEGGDLFSIDIFLVAVLS